MDIKGSIVALVTPITTEGLVDYAALERLIEFHINNNTNGIVVAGTTGESSTLSFDDHIQVIGFVIEKVEKRVLVIAGTGSNNTKEAFELTKISKDLGADAALLVTPYYNKPTQNGLYEHFKYLAVNIEIPQIIYNVPSRCVVNISNQTVCRLAELDNIVAIKDATGDLNQGRQLIEMCSNKINILSGDDSTAFDLIKLGGVGSISVTANVAPKLYSDMINNAINKDYKLAQKQNTRLDKINRALFSEANPIPVKYALYRMGMIQPEINLPLTWLSEEFHQLIDHELIKLDIELMDNKPT